MLADSAGAESRARLEGRAFVRWGSHDGDVGVQTIQVRAYRRPQKRGDAYEGIHLRRRVGLLGLFVLWHGGLLWTFLVFCQRCCDS